ncbi:AraC family transcriptional regulator [Advenella mimigardefordensis]|uniref:Transcriptional regulator, AraC family n=1 Tax=Advenella mimigardefordensis (strain DSM 17166 / LMG 22922 / DPN7) TaxID=1247726 RepID=W0PFC7_ADVMD|nr:AraC family transcriptional regulator [Advenella mimigardefordensis]AHG65386.1 transcriptional regulator, AraC family [Advenella mimigardefordensis DPN7]
MGILDAVPDSWGRKYECDGAAVANSLVDPTSIHFTTKAYFFLIMLSAQPDRAIAINSDRPVIGLAPAGCIEIVPESSELFSRWRHTKHSLLIAMTEQHLLNLTNLEWGDSLREFRLPKLGVVDEKALAIASEIRTELICAPFGYEACIDSLLTLFGIHVLRTYTSLNNQARQKEKIAGGLTPVARKRVLDYIHAHLSEKLAIETLAVVAGLSPSYFTRAFRQSMGQSPHEFIVATRLQAARRMIMTSSAPLSEISKINGFSSNSHMTALMKKTWGQNPTQIRYSDYDMAQGDGDDFQPPSQFHLK